jgi:geranylgeranyl pyrophosphate synthase
LGDLDRVRETVRKALTPEDPELVAPLQHFIDRPGKLLRPALVLATAYLIGGETPTTERAVTAASATEILHLASLYHDDLCDRSLIRRGVPTVNARYGESTALVLGDYLLATALGTAGSLGAQELAGAVRCAQQICTGQLAELRDTGNPGRSVAGYLYAVAGKTAALLSFSARLGVLAADGGDRRAEAAAACGHHLGVAFQIWNDLRDLTDALAEPTPQGAGPAPDLANGVYTLPVLYAMEHHAAELRPLLEASPIEPNLAGIAALVRGSGAFERARQVADGHLATAFARAGELSGPYGDAPALLRATLHRLLPEAVRPHPGDEPAPTLTGGLG